MSEDKIVQVSGFRVDSVCANGYMLVAVTESGKVLLSTGDTKWADVSPKPEEVDDVPNG